MNLNDTKKEPLRATPLDNKKKMLVMQYKGANQESKNKFDKPQQYLEYLEHYSKPENLSPHKLLNCVESLRVALTNNALSWVNEFGAEGGLQKLYKILFLATNKY